MRSIHLVRRGVRTPRWEVRDAAADQICETHFNKPSTQAMRAQNIHERVGEAPKQNTETWKLSRKAIQTTFVTRWRASRKSESRGVAVNTSNKLQHTLSLHVPGARCANRSPRVRTASAHHTSAFRGMLTNSTQGTRPTLWRLERALNNAAPTLATLGRVTHAHKQNSPPSRGHENSSSSSSA